MESQAEKETLNESGFQGKSPVFHPSCEETNLGSAGLSTLNNTFVCSDLLSRREDEILELLIKGMTNKEIAVELFLSSETVKTHLSRIFKKLGVRNRTEAAVKALGVEKLSSQTIPA